MYIFSIFTLIYRIYSLLYKMILVEQHIISKNNLLWKQCDHLCFLSKNLYNSTLYRIKNHYQETGKFLRYNHLAKEFLQNDQQDFRALPSSTSQQILMVFDQNIKSFFKLIRKWKNNKKSLSGCPHLPNYKHKIKGRNIIIFTSQQSRVKDGFIHLPKAQKIQNTLAMHHIGQQ